MLFCSTAAALLLLLIVMGGSERRGEERRGLMGISMHLLVSFGVSPRHNPCNAIGSVATCRPKSPAHVQRPRFPRHCSSEKVLALFPT